MIHYHLKEHLAFVLHQGRGAMKGFEKGRMAGKTRKTETTTNEQPTKDSHFSVIKVYLVTRPKQSFSTPIRHLPRLTMITNQI
jgi:hypothetical protein